MTTFMNIFANKLLTQNYTELGHPRVSLVLKMFATDMYIDT